MRRTLASRPVRNVLVPSKDEARTSRFRRRQILSEMRRSATNACETRAFNVNPVPVVKSPRPPYHGISSQINTSHLNQGRFNRYVRRFIVGQRQNLSGLSQTQQRPSTPSSCSTDQRRNDSGTGQIIVDQRRNWSWLNQMQQHPNILASCSADQRADGPGTSQIWSVENVSVQTPHPNIDSNRSRYNRFLRKCIILQRRDAANLARKDPLSNIPETHAPTTSLSLLDTVTDPQRRQRRFELHDGELEDIHDRSDFPTSEDEYYELIEDATEMECDVPSRPSENGLEDIDDQSDFTISEDEYYELIEDATEMECDVPSWPSENGLEDIDDQSDFAISEGMCYTHWFSYKFPVVLRHD